MNPGAVRHRRWRWREAVGKGVLVVEVDLERLAAVLFDEGTFLAERNPTRKQLAAAVADWIDATITRYERERGWRVDRPRACSWLCMVRVLGRLLEVGGCRAGLVRRVQRTGRRGKPRTEV